MIDEEMSGFAKKADLARQDLDIYVYEFSSLQQVCRASLFWIGHNLDCRKIYWRSYIRSSKAVLLDAGINGYTASCYVSNIPGQPCCAKHHYSQL